MRRLLLVTRGTASHQYQPFQDFIRLRANNPPPICHKGGDTRDAERPGALPIGIDSRLKLTRGKHFSGFVGGQTYTAGHLDEGVDPADVLPVDKIRPEEGVMDVTLLRLGVSPLPEFLRQPTIIRFGALPIRQAFLRHQTTHTGLARLQIDVASGKEFLEGQAVFRGVRM